MLIRMTETEAKWVERVREWERSGLPMDQFVVGKPYQASTLLWRKRQLQHQKRLEMAAPQRGRVAAARGRRRTATTESTRQLSPPSCPPIAMATVVRKPSMSRLGHSPSRLAQRVSQWPQDSIPHF